MDFEYLRKIFPNYTIGMYKGNEPRKKRLSVNGDYFNWYDDMSVKHGGFCEEYRGQCVRGEWSFGTETVFVEDSRQFDGKYHLAIMHNTGDFNSYWMYENNNGKCGLKVSVCCNKPPYVSEAKLRKILNSKAPSKSIAYKLFIAKAQELFELGDWKGEYRDL